MTKKLLDPEWVPDACTLPTVERPLRVAEFDGLFRDAVTAVARIDPQHAVLELRPEPAIAHRVAELAVRETQCCSFFTFTVTASGGRLALDVSVPPAQEAVLGTLVERAGIAAELVAR